MSIHGLILEVRVTGCQKLRDTEFFTRQDPYVVLEYGTTKLRTRTCTDGGRNPTFDEKFHIPLIEGLRELNVNVWNSNTLTHDDFIGNGRVYLHKVLTNGYDDSSWPLQTRHMRSAGEVKLIMRVDVSAMKNKMGRSVAASSAHPVPALSVPVPAPAPAAAAAAAQAATADEDGSKVDLAMNATTMGLLVPMAVTIGSLGWGTPWNVVYGSLLVVSFVLTITGFLTAVAGQARARRSRLSPFCARLGLLVAAALFVVFLSCKVARFGCLGGVAAAAVVVVVLAVIWVLSEPPAIEAGAVEEGGPDLV